MEAPMSGSRHVVFIVFISRDREVWPSSIETVSVRSVARPGSGTPEDDAFESERVLPASPEVQRCRDGRREAEADAEFIVLDADRDVAARPCAIGIGTSRRPEGRFLPRSDTFGSAGLRGPWSAGP